MDWTLTGQWTHLRERGGGFDCGCAVSIPGPGDNIVLGLLGGNVFNWERGKGAEYRSGWRGLRRRETTAAAEVEQIQIIIVCCAVNNQPCNVWSSHSQLPCTYHIIPPVKLPRQPIVARRRESTKHFELEFVIGVRFSNSHFRWQPA